MAAFVFGLVALFLPICAFAQVPSPDENLAGVIDVLVSAFQGGNWFAVGAVVVMLAVWALGKWVKDPGMLPLIAAGVGMLLSVVTSAVGGQIPWYVALYKGLLTSGSAALFWSLAGKRFLPSLVKAPEEPKPELDEKKDPPKEG